MNIGAQLYTVRQFCQTPEDFAQTLQKVADIGYRYVQVSGTCAVPPQWLKENLAKNGLRCVLTHTPVDRLTSDAAGVAADHSIFGCDCVGLGWYPFHKGDPAENLRVFTETFTPVARTLADNGKYFMYHNHDMEFIRIGGRTVYELLAEQFPKELMGFTLDTYWIQVAGGDPAAWLEKLTGRVPCIHLKDCAYERKMAVVGEGNINFDRVFEKAEAAGTQYMLVEQDDCSGEYPLDCLARSYRYLRAQGFE